MHVTPGQGIRPHPAVAPLPAQERVWKALEPFFENKTNEGYVRQRPLIREFKALVLDRMPAEFAGVSPEQSRDLVLRIARAAVPEGGSVRDFDHLVADLVNALEIACRGTRRRTPKEQSLIDAEYDLYNVLYREYDHRQFSSTRDDWPPDIFKTELSRFIEGVALDEGEFANMLDWLLPAFAHGRPRVNQEEERKRLLSVFRQVRGIPEPPPCVTTTETGVVQANATTAGIVQADVKTLATSQRITGFEVGAIRLDSSKVALRDDGTHAVTSALTLNAEIKLEIESILEQSIRALAAGTALDSVKVTMSSNSAATT